MSKVKAASDTHARRLEGILSTLKTIVNDLTGIQISDIDVDANFLEAGIDFLTLSQASQVIQEKFGVKLSVVQMLEVHGTIAAVAGYLDQNLPPDSVAPDQSSDPEPLELPHTSPPVQTQIEIVSNRHEQQLVGASSLEKIMSQQLLLMSRQLEMLREQHHSPVPAPVMKTAPVAAVAVPTPEKKPNLNPAPYVPYQPIKQVSSTSAPTTSTGPQFSGKESSSVNGHRSYSIPVTEAQRQLWITSQMGESASSAYNESITLYMRGQLDLPALKRALQQLVDRHESLRVTFSPEGDRQWVSPHVALELPYADFSSLDQTQREAAITEWIASEVRQTFDLAKGPLIRGRIAKAEEQYHLLILTHHHLVADGESGSILLRDLRALYAAEHLGIACELPAPKPFSEYVQRQTSERSEVETSEAEAYWLDQFADAVPILELPSNRPRPLVQTYHGAPKTLTVDPELYHELKRVSSQNNATLLMTLFAVSNILLHHLSGQDDIVVGCPAAGQVAAGVKEAVGYCINMLPVRSRWAANPTFVEYLRTVRRSLLNGYEHQNYSPGRLIEKLNIIWDPSRSPLFSVTFNFDKSGSGMLMEDLHVRVFQNAGSSVRFDLSLIFNELDNELQFECRYNTDLFDSRTIDRWMQCCLTLMRGIVSDPQQGVRDLPLLTDAEKQQLVNGEIELLIGDGSQTKQHERRDPGEAGLTSRLLEVSYVAPRDETENALAEIWAEVLRLERVGVENKFFDLGGHSLVALQIIARVRSTFQVQLTMRHIFEAPTVAQLAAEIKNIQLTGGTQEETSIDSFVAQDEERLLEDIDQLSDQQVDSLLNDLLREEEITNG